MEGKDMGGHGLKSAQQGARRMANAAHGQHPPLHSRARACAHSATAPLRYAARAILTPSPSAANQARPLT